MKKRIIIILTAAVLSAMLVSVFLPYRYVLTITTMPGEEEVYFLPVSENDHFQIQFIHSVHLSSVVEEYEMEGRSLKPVQLIYEDTAIGMPSRAGEGESFEMKNGKYYITNLQGSHSSLDLTIGQVKAEHTINYHDNSYLLKDSIEAGTWVRIAPAYVSVLELWRGVKLQ